MLAIKTKNEKPYWVEVSLQQQNRQSFGLTKHPQIKQIRKNNMFYLPQI